MIPAGTPVNKKMKSAHAIFTGNIRHPGLSTGKKLGRGKTKFSPAGGDYPSVQSEESQGPDELPACLAGRPDDEKPLIPMFLEDSPGLDDLSLAGLSAVRVGEGED